MPRSFTASTNLPTYRSASHNIWWYTGMESGLGGLGEGPASLIFAEVAPAAECCLQSPPLHWVHSVPSRSSAYSWRQVRKHTTHSTHPQSLPLVAHAPGRWSRHGILLAVATFRVDGRCDRWSYLPTARTAGAGQLNFVAKSQPSGSAHVCVETSGTIPVSGGTLGPRHPTGGAS